MTRIVIDETGAVEFTRSAALLALFPDQDKSIKRMTEVRFDEKRQKFYVQFILGPEHGENLTVGMVYRYQGHFSGDGITWLMEHIARQARDMDAVFGPFSILYFDSYEDGVKAEIFMVDAMRSATGETMHK